MTTMDDLGQLARQLAQHLGFTHETRAEFSLREHTLTWNKELADAAAGTATVELPIFHVPAGMVDGIEITRVLIKPNASLAADANDNVTLTVSKRTGAGAATVVATAITTAGGTGSWVALTDVTIALSATLANRQLAAGDQLTFLISKAMAGKAVPACTLYIEYKEL